MLSMIDPSVIWKLHDRPALLRWLHPEGNLILLGDSTHPMLPCIAQGASSAVEDAAALATCLEFITDDRDLRSVLGVYEKIRLPRTLRMRKSARANKDCFYLPDGELLYKFRMNSIRPDSNMKLTRAVARSSRCGVEERSEDH